LIEAFALYFKFCSTQSKSNGLTWPVSTRLNCD